LRKIKACTKADRHPGNDAYIKAASDERDGLLNDSNQKYLPRRLSFAGNLLHRIAFRRRPAAGLPGIVGKKTKSRLLGDQLHLRGHAGFCYSALVHRLRFRLLRFGRLELGK
jgi:hypothetical protein